MIRDDAYNKLICPSCDWMPPKYGPPQYDRQPPSGDVLSHESRLLEYIAHLLETKHNARDGKLAAQR